MARAMGTEGSTGRVGAFYDAQSASGRSSRDTELFSVLMGRAIPYSYALLGEIAGKKVLEIGCGSGEQALRLAQMGAKVVAVDLSPQHIASLKSRMRQQRLRNLTAMVMDAEAMPFNEDSFDAIYINSLLMHVNPELVLSACRRMLKAGGVVVIVEPLKYHPLALLYRCFSSYRSTQPRYMTLGHFKRLQGNFQGFEQREFLFLSLVPAMVRWLLKLPPPGGRFLGMVEGIDDALIRLVPPLGNLYWLSVVRYQK